MEVPLPVVIIKQSRQPPTHTRHPHLGIPLVVEADEGKTTTLPGELVLRDEDVSDLAVLLEQVLNVVGGGAVGEVVHFEGHHLAGVGRRPSRITRHFAKLLKILKLILISIEKIIAVSQLDDANALLHELFNQCSHALLSELNRASEAICGTNLCQKRPTVICHC